MRKASFQPAYDEKKKRYYVSIPPSHTDSGTRKREYFETKKTAQKRSDELLKIQNQSALAASMAGPELIRVAMDYDELFRTDYGYGLEDACKELIAIKERESNSGTLGDLLDRYEREHYPSWGDRSKRTWTSVRKKIDDLEDQPLMTLDTEFWSDWLTEQTEKNGWKDSTFNDLLSRLRSVWERAKKLRLVEHNPIDPIKKRKVRREEKPVYSPEQVKALLDCAWKFDRELVPFFAIAIFAGLRPDEKGEIFRLQWEDVNFEEKWIRVVFGNKTDTQRFVRIEDNLLAWLEPWRGKTGPVLPTNFRTRRRAITRGKYQAPENSPEKKWKELVPYGSEVRDITRHTYGSYFDAMFRDRNLLKEHMGHADFRTYDQHYRNARKKKEAEKFWAIVPPKD